MPRSLKGEAYQVQEIHEGPPKSYISEKLTNGIEAQYHLIKNIYQYIPDNLSSPLLTNSPPNAKLKNDFFTSEAKAAFRYMVNAFLALHNRLGLMDDNIIDELLNDSEDNLNAWLNRVEFVKSK